MKILRNNPKKWELTQVTVDNQKVIFTGYNETGELWRPHIKQEDGSRKKVPNVIFEASIKAVSMSRGRSSVITFWEDRDCVHKYQTGPKSTLEVIQALQSRNFNITPDGFISGIFTFVKQGGSIYLKPLYS